MASRYIRNKRQEFINGGPYHPAIASRFLKFLWPKKFKDMTEKDIQQALQNRLPINECISLKPFAK